MTMVTPNGLTAAYDDALDDLAPFLTADEAAEVAYLDEGPTCRLCDGLGHGYPGGGPCPLEERGASFAA